MAGGAPTGNSNATKGKRLFNSALKRALTQGPERIEKIVNMLIEQAEAGEPWAVKELIDRVDGKPAQSIIGGDDDDPAIRTVSEILIRAVDAANS